MQFPSIEIDISFGHDDHMYDLLLGRHPEVGWGVNI
jgi:hypothetical protein